MSGGTPAPARPVLAGRTVTLRPGRPGDAGRLRAILAEPSVSRWWGNPAPVEALQASLRRFHDGLLMDMLAAELRFGL